MSSLIFYTQADAAIVATDTLGVDAYGHPFCFTNKATYLPTLKTIICGTGFGGFSSSWAERVNSRMILSSIDNLDYHTPSGLVRLWDEFKQNYSIPENNTATVYQIGFSDESNEISAFAYRSTNGFSSERLGYGTAVRPECSVIDGDLLKAIPLMMSEQRDIQSKLPPEQRLYIGGEIHAIILERSGCRHLKLFEFPDYHVDRELIFPS